MAFAINMSRHRWPNQASEGVATLYHRHHSSMGHGKVIPEDMHWIVIRLSSVMSVDEIAMYMDIGKRSVIRILSYFKATGSVKNAKQAIVQAHRSLCDYDIQVFPSLTCTVVSYQTGSQHLHAIINDKPDVYLDKLCLELLETCGVSVMTSTIWQTLVKGGFSMKKVHELSTQISTCPDPNQLSQVAIEWSAQK
jgi:transposase